MSDDGSTTAEEAGSDGTAAAEGGEDHGTAAEEADGDASAESSGPSPAEEGWERETVAYRGIPRRPAAHY
ncbi:hypothetical protein DJ72_09830, partial [Halorubrum distributum]